MLWNSSAICKIIHAAVMSSNSTNPRAAILATDYSAILALLMGYEFYFVASGMMNCLLDAVAKKNRFVLGDL